MSGFSETCLDSNLLIRSLHSRRYPEARMLWRQWLRDKITLHAPALLRYEVVNALHRMRRSGELPADAVDVALRKTLTIPIVLHQDDGLHFRALEMAAKYQLPAAYDSQYLALAERLGVELWTTDAKLVRAVEDRLAWVRLVS